MRIEGPFGDHTGFYTPPEPYPTFNLTGIMRRKDPIYLATVVGKPVLEDAYIGKVIEQSFLPLIQMFQPEVVDFLYACVRLVSRYGYNIYQKKISWTGKK